MYYLSPERRISKTLNPNEYFPPIILSFLFHVVRLICLSSERVLRPLCDYNITSCQILANFMKLCPKYFAHNQIDIGL